MKGRVTMRDVAAKAGVHVTTVSLALRNHPSLPASTRDRLQRLAAQMGYRPDPALSALVGYRHRAGALTDKPVLAYVTRWDSQWGWKDFAAHRAFYDGATGKAAELGYQLEHFWLGEPGMTNRRMSGILLSRGIPGVILASHRREAEAPLDFDWPHFSAVKIDYSPREPQLHLVTNDQSAIIRLAVQRVLAAGYRRIGLVMPHWWDDFVDLAWSAGFLAEQQRLAARERIPILFYSAPFRPEESTSEGRYGVVPQELFQKWRERHRPEVVLSRSPFVQPCFARLSPSARPAFVEIFLEKPDGRIAGVHHNCLRVGESAVEILAGQLYQHVTGVPAIPTATFVEGTWFDGASLPPRAG